MQNLILNFNILLSQTKSEKNLTILYVALFAFLCLLLFMDSRDGKKIVGENKSLGKIIVFMLFIDIIGLAVAYFVL